MVRNPEGKNENANPSDRPFKSREKKGERENETPREQESKRRPNK